MGRPNYKGAAERGTLLGEDIFGVVLHSCPIQQRDEFIIERMLAMVLLLNRDRTQLAAAWRVIPSLHGDLYFSFDQELRAAIQLYFFAAGSEDGILTHLQVPDADHAHGFGIEQRNRVAAAYRMNSGIRSGNGAGTARGHGPWPPCPTPWDDSLQLPTPPRPWQRQPRPSGRSPPPTRP